MGDGTPPEIDYDAIDWTTPEWWPLIDRAGWDWDRVPWSEVPVDGVPFDRLPPLVPKGADREAIIGEVIKTWCTSVKDEDRQSRPWIDPPKYAALAGRGLVRGEDDGTASLIDWGGIFRILGPPKRASIAGRAFVQENQDGSTTPIDLGYMLRLVRDKLCKDYPRSCSDKVPGIVVSLEACRIDLCQAERIHLPCDLWLSRIKFNADARFAKAHFRGDVGFEHARFCRDGAFGDAEFYQDANYANSHFDKDAGFGGSQFKEQVSFNEVCFVGEARFGHAYFDKDAWFENASFAMEACFEDSYFGKRALFKAASFADIAGFQRVRFAGDARFKDVRFGKPASFEVACFDGDAKFSSAMFQSECSCIGAQFLDHPVDGDRNLLAARLYTNSRDAVSFGPARPAPWRGFFARVLWRAWTFLDVQLHWGIVRGFGELAILTRVSTTALVAVPVAAAVWPVLRAAADRWAGGASEFPGNMPWLWAALFFAALFVVLGRAVYQSVCPEFVRERSRLRVIEDTLAEYREAKEHEQRYMEQDALEAVKEAGQHPVLRWFRHPNIVKHYGLPVWLPEKAEHITDERELVKAEWWDWLKEVDDERARALLRNVYDADPEYRGDTPVIDEQTGEQATDESGALMWEPFPEDHPWRRTAEPDRPAASRQLVAIRAGADARYDIVARQNRQGARVALWLYVVAGVLVVTVVYDQSQAILRETGIGAELMATRVVGPVLGLVPWSPWIAIGVILVWVVADALVPMSWREWVVDRVRRRER